MVELSRRDWLRYVKALGLFFSALAIVAHGCTPLEALAANAEDTVIDEMVFYREDITVVLSALAQLTDDLSVVADSSVSGAVSQTLRDIKLLDAMDLIIKANGFDYRRKGNVVVVATPERLQSTFDQVEVAVIPLSHRLPADIVPILDLVVPAESVREDSRTRSIVVSGTSAQVSLVRTLVTQLDRPLRQVWVQARIEEIASSQLKNLGIKWDDPTLRLQQNPIGQVIGAAVDVLPKLALLQDQGYSRTVASPQLLVEEGSRSRVLLGDRIPVKLVTQKPDGTLVETWEYYEAGVRLEVTPQFRSADEVTLTLRPEISAVNEDHAGASLPWLKTREVETVVRMRDGETAAIGGLLQTQELESLFKVPLLGDIPIMGELFKRTDKDISQTELLIFITVMIIDESRGQVLSDSNLTGGISVESPPATSLVSGH
jgi:type II secretory pathway component GspD/PulD (secretin)